MVGTDCHMVWTACHVVWTTSEAARVHSGD
jgi:hypothetical protein